MVGIRRQRCRSRRHGAARRSVRRFGGPGQFREALREETVSELDRRRRGTLELFGYEV